MNGYKKKTVEENEQELTQWRKVRQKKNKIKYNSQTRIRSRTWKKEKEKDFLFLRKLFIFNENNHFHEQIRTSEHFFFTSVALILKIFPLDFFF